MGFPDSGTAQQDDVTRFSQEASGSEFFKQSSINTGLGSEIKIGQAFEIRKITETQAGIDGALFARRQFGFQEPAQEVAIAPVFSGSLLSKKGSFPPPSSRISVSPAVS